MGIFSMEDEKCFIRPEEACKILQVTLGTLRSWAKRGKIEYTRTKGGHRRYKLSSILKIEKQEIQTENNTRRKVCYARVSSYTQKKDLETQLHFFQDRYKDHEVFRDIGSGLNFKRRNFLFLLDEALKGNIEEIVVTHRDRLCRFGFELFERILQARGGRIVVHFEEEKFPEQELTQDLLSIITVFSARLYGLRSHSLKRKIKQSSNKQAGSERKEIQNLKDAYLSD